MNYLEAESRGIAAPNCLKTALVDSDIFVHIFALDFEHISLPHQDSQTDLLC